MRKISIAALASFTAVAALSAAPPAFTTIYSFTNTGDGTRPNPPVIGPGGVLYGTTNNNTAYSLAPPSSPGGPWTEQTLYTFQGGASDGAFPVGKLIQSTGPDGQLMFYGLTQAGGPANGGTAYSLTAPTSPNSAWAEEVLYFFDKGGSRSTDGVNPITMFMGAGGVLYGITYSTAGCRHAPCGTVFSLTPPATPGAAWSEIVLQNYLGADSLVMGADGVLYGTTLLGGLERPACLWEKNGSCGTVFSLAPPSSPGGNWTFATIYSFDGATGFAPLSLAVGADGVLFGSTFINVYSLTPPASPGGAWTQAVIANFKAPRFSGGPPFAITVGSAGVIYGATMDGGRYQGGSLFALMPPVSSGGSWTLKTLVSVNPANQGVGVQGFVIGPGPHPAWYGATSGGEVTVNALGTIFEFQP